MNSNVQTDNTFMYIVQLTKFFWGEGVIPYGLFDKTKYKVYNKVKKVLLTNKNIK